MITREHAERLVCELINSRDPQWPNKPETIVVGVEERELGWVFYYTSRIFHETGDNEHAIAGNGPLFVSREDGEIVSLGTTRIAERLRAVEQELKARSGGSGHE